MNIPKSPNFENPIYLCKRVLNALAKYSDQKDFSKPEVQRAFELHNCPAHLTDKFIDFSIREEYLTRFTNRKTRQTRYQVNGTEPSKEKRDYDRLMVALAYEFLGKLPISPMFSGQYAYGLESIKKVLKAVHFPEKHMDTLIAESEKAKFLKVVPDSEEAEPTVYLNPNFDPDTI